MSKLRISDDLSLPLEATTQTFGVVGKKRSGKTTTAIVMAEEFLKRKIAPVIIDPLDVAWGLKSGFPIYVFGGAHQDAVLEPTAGELMADIMVDERVPMILSLKHFDSDAAQGRFVTAFAQRALKRNQLPVPIIIDEADKYAPQRPMPGEQVMLGAVDRMVRHGGASGLGVTLITQRPALLNKNVLNQVDTLIIMRLVGPTDIDAIEQWINRHGTKEEREKILASLPTLETGEAWIYSPEWLEILKRVRIRKRETFDSSRTPKVGEKLDAPKELASVDIAKLGEKIAATVERAKADDPKALRAQLAVATKKIAELERSTPKVDRVVERVEVPVVPAEILERLDSMAKTAGEMRDTTVGFFNAWRVDFERLRGLCKAVKSSSNSTSRPQYPQNAERNVDTRSTVTAPREPSPRSVPQRGNSAMAGIPHNGKSAAAEDRRIGGAPARMLQALASFPGGAMTRRQLAIAATVPVKTSTFRNALSILKGADYISISGNDVAITDAGRATAPAGAVDQRSIVETWRAKFGGATLRMLDLLLDRPEGMSRADLAAGADVDVTTSTFRNSLSLLRSAGAIIVEREYVRADESLTG